MHLQCQYVAVFMDINHIVLGWRCIIINSYKLRSLDIGLVIALASSLRAHHIIIAHNNPSGDLINTRKDNKLYKDLLAVCSHLHCHLQDQLIISLEGYYSYIEHNYAFL